MIFAFLKNRITKKEIEILKQAEESLNIALLNTYEKLSKKNREKFLALAESYNKAHAEYLEIENRYGNIDSDDKTE